MSPRIPRDYMTAMSLIEAAGEFAGQLDRLFSWPGLSLETRAVGACALILGAPHVTVGQVAEHLGMTVDEVYGALSGGRGGPFDVVTVGTATPRPPRSDHLIYPSEALAYGTPRP